MCSLTIDVTNFYDNDIVSYSLVLIKGVILCDSSFIFELEQIECSANGCYTFWPVINNNFRCLASLNEGRNDVRLKFRNNSKHIYLEFRRRPSSYCVFPIFVVFNEEDNNGNELCDNSFVDIRTKIGFCAKLLQCFYAEKLFEKKFGRKTFQLIEGISDKYQCCYLFRSKLSLTVALSLSPESLWETLGREIMKSEVGNPKYKYLAVASLLSVSGDSDETVCGEIALGSGGLALIDSRPVFSWPRDIFEVLPCFKDSTPLVPPLSLNAWYRGTRGGCCSASIGSLCHELGHTFDLGHPDSGIMSTDFHLFHNAFIPALNDTNPTSFDLHFIPNITTVQTSCNRNRVTNLRKPISNRQIKKTNDKSSFTLGCLSILALHKWFNESEQEYKIEFDPGRVLLQSEAGLKVVQMRGNNGKIIKSWELNGDKTEHMILPRSQSCITVFAMDNYGNIFKFPFNDMS